MNYLQIIFSKNDEILLAHLSQLPFESFQEMDDMMIGYIESDLWTEDVVQDVQALMLDFGFSYEVEPLPDINWNEEWESNFDPVDVENFCRIRAEFHPSKKSDFVYEIIIRPKMAFGTGHHQTTYMMIKAMASLNFKDKIVLDYGSGTGILAMVADKMGAHEVIAVDIEAPSFDNCKEHADLNDCPHIIPILGDIQAVEQKAFDVVLANINRNVLMDTVDEILLRLKSGGGKLLLSGILKEDKAMIIDLYQSKGLELVSEDQRDNWVMLTMERS